MARGRGPALTRVGIPPLQPGLPIVWCPTIVVCGLVVQLRRCGVSGRLPHGLLDELVAPWGLKRHGGTRRFTVPCDCGRQVRRLVLTASGWACSRCDVHWTQLEMYAARLLFALRLGLRGRYPRWMHQRVVRLLLGKLPSPRKIAHARRFQMVQAATVVVSYDPAVQSDKAWRPLGPLGRELAGTVLQVWLDDWASPVAYAARCRAELGL